MKPFWRRHIVGWSFGMATLLVGRLVQFFWESAYSGPIGAAVAAGQAEDSTTAFATHQAVNYNDVVTTIIILATWVLVFLFLIPTLKDMFKLLNTYTGKKNTVAMLAVTGSFLVSCGPVKVERFVEIGENETAFLVPLEGAGKKGQAKFMSVDYLNEAKVATKRVSLPLREHITGRMPGSYTWIPTMKVVKVDRTPVTREWTGGKETGTSTKNQALWVESEDSIGFGVGVNITSMIREEDAAKFLYYYAGKPLTAVVDENVRGKVNSILSREFAAHKLEEARKKKNEVFKKVADETIQEFKNFGITIANLGLAEGMVYENPKIQQSIDSVFAAEMRIQSEESLAAAQKKTNERLLSIAANERAQAEEFAIAAEARKKQAEVEVALTLAKAKLAWVEKWDGKLPEKILPEGSNLLMGLDAK